MNRIYRIVFNRTLGVPQVVSELASAPSSSQVGAVAASSGGSLRMRTLVAAVGLALATVALPTWAQSCTQTSGTITSSCAGTTSANGATGSGGTGGSPAVTGSGTGGSASNGGLGGANAGNGGNGSPYPYGNYSGGGGGGGGVYGGGGGTGLTGTYYNPSGAGAAGGGGNAGLVATGSLAINSGVTVAGGSGGNGGIGYYNDFGGGGGGGGGGVSFGINSASLDNAGRIVGGSGGYGGAAFLAGGGGGGGMGLNVSGAGNQVTNSGSILGGNGGNGGSVPYYPGSGGAGGAGLSVGGDSNIITNTGSITGGNGGTSNRSVGAGGIGLAISSNDNTLITSGSISGGLDGAGNNRNYAVDITGSDNTLELESGYSFAGSLHSTSGNGNVLALAGSTDASFDVSSVVGGFDTYYKTGSSTWTLTGTSISSTPWTIADGTLQVGSGGTSGSISGDILDNSALAFDRSDAVTFGGAISGTGSLRQIGTGTTTLTGANTYNGSTTIDSGTLAIAQGGSVANTAMVLDNGTLTVDGAGSSITATGGGSPFFVGLGGTGTLTASNGAMVGSNGELNIGNNAGDVGTVTITSGATLNVATYVNIGQLGTGTLNVSNGGMVNLGEYFSIGDGAGSVGDVTVTGAGSSITETGAQLSVGTHNATGTLTVADGATVSAPDIVIGNDGSTGTLNIGAAAGDAAAAPGTLISGNGQVRFGSGAGTLVFNHTSTGYTFAPAITGNGAVDVLAGTTILTADNTYTGGTAIGGGTLVAGNSNALGFGNVDMAAGTTVAFAADGLDIANSFTLNGDPTVTLSGGQTETLSGTIADGGSPGTLELNGDGTGTLTLVGANTYTGGTILNAGTLAVSSDGNLGGAAGSLTFNGGTLDNTAAFTSGRDVAVQTGGGTLQTDADLTETGTISGSGALAKTGSGVLTLDGGSSSYAGAVEVQAGSLIVGDSVGNGAVLGNPASTVSVDSGASLGGLGTLGGSVTIASGGTLAPGAGSSLGTLTVGGDLAVAQGGQLDFAFGAAAAGNPFGAAGTGSNVAVIGNLTLNGAVLNIADAGGMGPGLYNLFSYSGSLNETNGGITLGSAPAGGLYTISNLTGQHQIDLYNTAGYTLNVWDGNGLASSTQLGGGDGTWSVGSVNWSDVNGNGPAPMTPQSGFAIFGGAAGTVTVDNSAGNVQASGLQFASNGYNLTGDVLTLVGSDGVAPIIQVGDGSSAGAGYIATINAPVQSNDGLTKTDLGTLVLTGGGYVNNGVTVSGGVLQLGTSGGAAGPNLSGVNGASGTSASGSGAQGVGGNGMDGGAGVTLAGGNLVNGNATVVGGSGGSGASGWYEYEIDGSLNARGGVGGAGGNGGAGVASTASGASVSNTGSIYGGSGGYGGYGAGRALDQVPTDLTNGGNGGNGGAGISLTGNGSSVTNQGTVSGGNGGIGSMWGNDSYSGNPASLQTYATGHGGNGGAGGNGIELGAGASFANLAGGVVTGGNGGSAYGWAGSSTPGNGGTGGNGGIGVVLGDNPVSASNLGSIRGGNGGQGANGSFGYINSGYTNIVYSTPSGVSGAGGNGGAALSMGAGSFGNGASMSGGNGGAGGYGASGGNGGDGVTFRTDAGSFSNGAGAAVAGGNGGIGGNGPDNACNSSTDCGVPFGGSGGNGGGAIAGSASGLSASNAGSVSGGNGGNGGNGGGNNVAIAASASGDGGVGGAGGTAVALGDNASFSNLGTGSVTGGNGGRGGYGAQRGIMSQPDSAIAQGAIGNGGNGGAGGSAVMLGSQGSFSNAAGGRVTGGYGGSGGSARNFSAGGSGGTAGNGGAGGTAVIFGGAVLSADNQGYINGGYGGRGGNGAIIWNTTSNSISVTDGGTGGSGGDALAMHGGDFSNEGMLTGGSGGAGGSSGGEGGPGAAIVASIEAAPSGTPITPPGAWNGGNGGAGGQGGTALTMTDGTTTNSGSLIGGYGGYAGSGSGSSVNCSSSGCTTGTVGVGGVGGHGGAGVNLAGGSLTNTGSVIGGQGGMGGMGGNGPVYTAPGSYSPTFTPAGAAGVGGNGGTAAILTGGSLSNGGDLVGGVGGQGGWGNGGQVAYDSSIGKNVFSAGSVGGNGGTGGAAADIANATLTNTGGVTGGAGGAGGTGGSGAYLYSSSPSDIAGDGGAGGQGGNGGVAVSLASHGVLVNTGTVQGGSGGSAGAGGTGGSTYGYVNGSWFNTKTGADGAAGSVGLGGVAVVGNGNSTVINGGTIAGGLSGDGSIQADAVDFAGGGNTLELRSGYVFAGAISAVRAAGQAADTLALGGSIDSGFALAQLAPGATFGDFNAYQKNGSSTWVLTGTGASTQNWTITDGLLQGDATAFAGNLTLAPTAGNNAGVVFDQGTDNANSTATGIYAGVVSGNGSLAKTGDGTLVLTGANTYSGGTTINAGTLQLGNGGTTGAIVGNVVDNGTLAFDRSDVVTFGGVVSGTGALAQNGSGTLILTGANTYSGGTTIGSGTLQLGNGSTTGAIVGNVVDNGTLAFDRSDAVTFGGVVSGTGALAQNGSGTLTLTGANTYSGGTTIGSGTLQLGNGGSNGSIAGNVVDNGKLAFDRSNAATFGGVVSGSGALAQNGNGTLTLTGTNSYSGGTTIGSGTLQLGNGGTTGAIVGNVADNGTLSFDRSDAVTFGGMVSGTGSLVQNGSGTLVLTGANTYSGGTTINAGTLQGDTTSLRGTITDHAALVFNQTVDGLFAGSLTGNGTLTKTGAGTLLLDGHNAFAGNTTVQAGTLEVGDAATPSAFLGGNVQVNAGGTLRGHGSIGGNVVNDGTMWPGGSIGTLTIQGNYTQNADGTLTIDTLPNGQASLLAVGGKATILGGSAVVLAQAGNWAPRTSYTILTAAGGVSGQFASASSSLLFLNPVLSYTANAVNLSLQRNDINFASVAQTANQRAVATVTNGFGFASPMYSAMTLLDAPTAQHTFDQLSGVIHASTRTALVDDSRYVRDAINRHLLGQNDGAEGTTDQGVGVWTSVWGHGGRHDDNGDAALLQANGSGLLVGADLSLGNNARLGAVLGHGQSSIQSNSVGSSAHVLGDHVGLYGSTTFGALVLRAGAAYSWQDVHNNRTLAFGSYSDHLSSEHHAQTAQAYVEGGYQFKVSPGQQLEPFVNVARVQLHSDALQEGGGNAALAIAGNNASVNTATLGLRDTLTLNAASGIHAHASIGWQQAWGDLTPVATMRFVTGGSSFAISGVPVARHALATDLGIDFKLAKNVSVDASYLGQFASGARDQGARMTLNVSF
jgi:fibronectin-binding autotransporter adhesin